LIDFSHIYVEEDSYEYPTTSTILNKYPNATKIEIKNYKHIFNRANQNFQAQKDSVKLVLAVRRDSFYYKGVSVSYHSKVENFYYNTLILNCVYNCEYCYLQGMFHSGNVVVFVNRDDYFRETATLLADTPVYLSLSYETDILAFEDLIPNTSHWIDFARTQPNLTMEIQTKSNNYKSIQNLKASKNVILAWTISPEEIIKKYEKETPTLNQRLTDIQSAINDGWKVRICFDPILPIKGWKEVYSNLIKDVFSTIQIDKIFDLCLDTLRLNTDFLKKMKKRLPLSDILYYPFERVGTLSVFPERKADEMIKFIVDQIRNTSKANNLFQSPITAFRGSYLLFFL
jgi:spore photoproduct lyase